MKIQDLKTFEKVCYYKSISRAADDLKMSQPAISYCLRNLEKEFNLKLIVRKPHGIDLTVEGELFLVVAKELIAQEESAERRFHDIAKKSNQLRIACPPMFCKTSLPEWINNIHKVYPKLVFHVKEMGSLAMVRDLLGGKIDCAIFPMMGLDNPLLDHIKVTEDYYRIFLWEDHPLSKKKMLTVEDLLDEQFVVLDNTFYNNAHVPLMFQKKGYTPNIYMETNQFDTIRNMVTNKKAISLVYSRYVKYCQDTLGDNVVGVPCSDSMEKQEICLWWVKNKYLLSSLRDVIDLHKEKKQD